MHELSIAQNIIEIAESNARSNHAGTITEIEVEIGSVSGVIYEALDFAMQVAVKNTLLENAEIKISVIQAKAKCKGCHQEFTLQDEYAICPFCSCLKYDIFQGKELRVVSILIE